jgi:ferrous iron transport protein B
MSDYVDRRGGQSQLRQDDPVQCELTGAKQRVGNWPGVTVERKSGEYIHEGKKIEVVDLPGIYSLSAASLDEEVARDYILSGEADLIVNIVDASNLESNLYLTVQLLEMNVFPWWWP